MLGQKRGSWLGWLGAAVAAIGLLSLFLRVGGLGSDQSAVALASGRSTQTGGSPRIVSLSLNDCAGPTLSGSVGVGEKFTGQVTLDLFALSPSPQHLTRRFIDTKARGC